MKVFIEIEEEIRGKQYALKYVLHSDSEIELLETYRRMLEIVKAKRNAE